MLHTMLTAMHMSHDISTMISVKTGTVNILGMPASGAMGHLMHEAC